MMCSSNRISRINRLIDAYVTTDDRSRQVSAGTCFAQSANVNNNIDLPLQGWKFHISANNLEDYERLLNVALPELCAQNTSFKIVKPESFDSFMSGPQVGKCITIWMDRNFSFENFSKQFMDILSEPAVLPPNEMQLSGRLSARYGRFMSSHVYGQEKPYLCHPYGGVSNETRHSDIAPMFVKEKSFQELTTLTRDMWNELQRTNDFKTYLQNSILMTKADGVAHAYTTFEIPNQSLANAIQGALAEYDPYSLSFIKKFNENEVGYLMLHDCASNELKNSINNLFYQFGEIPRRPEWDCRYNYCNLGKIVTKDIEQLVSEFNRDSFENPNMNDYADIIKCGNNYFLKFDTSSYRKMYEMMQDKNISLYISPMNISERDEHRALKQFVHQNNLEHIKNFFFDRERE